MIIYPRYTFTKSFFRFHNRTNRGSPTVVQQGLTMVVPWYMTTVALPWYDYHGEIVQQPRVLPVSGCKVNLRLVLC